MKKMNVGRKSEAQFKAAAEANLRHYRHACEKHPGFVDEFCGLGLDAVKHFLSDARNEIRQQEKDGELTALSILQCEIWEIFEAYERGEYESARYEVRDAIAVLERMDDFVRAKQSREQAG